MRTDAFKITVKYRRKIIPKYRHLLSSENQAKRAFLNDLGQIHEVCSFEDIGQSRFHAKLFKNAHNCRRKQNFEHCPTQPSESRIYFYHGVIILNRSNNSQISIETSAPLRKQVVLL